MEGLLPSLDRRRPFLRWESRRRQSPTHPGGPRAGPHPRRRHHQEHQPHRQDQHSPQQGAGDPPVRHRHGRALQPLRRHHPRFQK